MSSRWYLMLMVGLSMVLSVYGALLILSDLEVGEALSTVWMLVFALLVALWARGDAAEKKMHRPLDFPAYFFLAWPVALPYYLMKTRGLEGLVLFCGFAVLHFAPFLSGVAVYAYMFSE